MALRRLRAVLSVGMIVLATAVAPAKPPEWVQPLLGEDVSELGRGYRWVWLADLGSVEGRENGTVRFRTRGAIRVLTEEGRTGALCSWIYNADNERVVTARAWVVSADGKRSETFQQRDFVDLALRWDGIEWSQQREVAFSAAKRVEVGGAFVWEFEVESPPGVHGHGWEFTGEIPTLLNTFDVLPPPGGRVVWHASGPGVPEPTPGTAPGALHWEERRYQPGSGLDKPTGFLRTARRVAVRFEVPGRDDQIRQWADMARLSHGLFAPRIAAGSPALAAKAAALVEGKTERWARIRALAEFVQKEITYLAITMDKDALAGYRPHAAEEVLSNRYGDCKDKATVLIALLRSIGDDGRVVLLYSGNPTAVRKEWPAPQFNHAIVAIPVGDVVPPEWPLVTTKGGERFVLFDPTDSFTPLGLLPDEDQGGHGLLVDPGTTDLVALPHGRNAHRAEVTIRLDPTGNATVTSAETWTGYVAAETHAERERGGTEKYHHVLEEYLHNAVSSANALRWTESWEPAQAQRRLEMNFEARRYGRSTGGLMLVNPQVLAANRRLRPWKTGLPGVVWNGAENDQQEIRITLPEGKTVDEVPDPWEQSTPMIKGSVRYRQEADAVIAVIEWTAQPGFLDKAAYEELRRFLLRLEEATRRPIVLRNR